MKPSESSVPTHGRRIRDLTEEDCAALLGDEGGRVALTLTQKRILAAHAIAVGYGYGKVTITVYAGKSRLQTQLDDLLPDE